MKTSFISFLCSCNVLFSRFNVYVFMRTSKSVNVHSDYGVNTNHCVENVFRSMLSLYRFYFSDAGMYTDIYGTILYRNENTVIVKVPLIKRVSKIDLLGYIVDNKKELCQDNNYPPVLHSCVDSFAMWGDESILTFMVDNGFDVNREDLEGNNLLIRILYYDSMGMSFSLVKRVIDKTCDINHTNSENNNALFLCIVNNYSDIFDYLLGISTIDISTPIIDDITLDIFCIITNNTHFFTKLVGHPTYNYNGVTSHSETACLLCVLYDRLDMFQILLDGVDVNIKDELGNDILMYCLLYEKSVFLHYLIKRRYADLNFDVLNEYIKNYGLFDRSVSNIIFLLNHGADINHADEDGNTPLINSIVSENFFITEVLLQYKPDVCHRNNGGNNALYYLCETNNLYLIQIIFSFGRYNLDGNKILCALYRNNKKRLFKMLLDNFIEMDIFGERDCLLCSSIYLGTCDRSMVYMWKLYYHKNYFATIIKNRYRVYRYSKIHKVFDEKQLSTDIIDAILKYSESTGREECLRKLIRARRHFNYHFHYSEKNIVSCLN